MSTEKMFVVVPAFQVQLTGGGVVEDKQQLQVPRTKEQLAQAIGELSHAAFEVCFGGNCDSVLPAGCMFGGSANRDVLVSAAWSPGNVHQ